MPNMCNNKKDNINAVNNNSSQKLLLSNHSHVHLYHSQDKTKTTEILNLAKMYKHTPDILHSIWVLFSEAMKILTFFFLLFSFFSCYPLTWNM